MSDLNRNELFVHLLTEHRCRIFSFISILTAGSSIDAEEIFQEVSIVAWRKLDHFDFDTDFVRWINQISYFQVLQHRKKQNRETSVLGEHFLERIAQEIHCNGDALLRERKALHVCLKKLKEEDHDLIQRRYYNGESAGEIASSLDRPTTSICRLLQRIRRRLYSCIRHTIAIEDSLDI